jgi:ABC-type hemin transport system substrate-binding protein
MADVSDVEQILAERPTRLVESHGAGAKTNLHVLNLDATTMLLAATVRELRGIRELLENLAKRSA